MAMTEAPEPTDLERLQLHLIDVGVVDVLTCPVCRQHGWEVLGPVLGVTLDDAPTPGVLRGRSTMQVVCRTCFYLRYFLWEPIRQRQFSSEALEALRQKAREAEVVPSTASEGRRVEGGR